MGVTALLLKMGSELWEKSILDRFIKQRTASTCSVEAKKWRTSTV